MEFSLDADVQRVLEFMQDRIPVSKLVGVSEALPQMARLLWGRFPQEPVEAAQLSSPKEHPLQAIANECALAQ